MVPATDGFERAELTERVKALRQSGAAVGIVSPKGGEIQSMQHNEKGATTVDAARHRGPVTTRMPDDLAAFCKKIRRGAAVHRVSATRRYRVISRTQSG